MITFFYKVSYFNKSELRAKINQYQLRYTNMKFLIVEDDADLRELITMMVASNYEVNITEASNGEEAIEKITHEGPFDIILCDYNMPKKNGAQVFAELRKLHSQTPFICISSDIKNFTNQFANAAHTDTLSKPFDEKDLLKKIESLLAKKITPSQLRGYFPVSIALLHKIFTPEVSLYIQLNENQYIKILKESSIFDAEQVERFNKKNLKFLYIEMYEMKTLITNLRKNIFSQEKWNEINATEAVQNLEADWSLILEGSRSFGWSESIKKLAKENIAITLELIKKNPDLKKALDRLKVGASDSLLSAHAYTLIFLTISILKELKWDSQLTVQKITFASLLHDMDLTEPMFENKLNLIAKGRLFSELHIQTNYQILNHAKTAAEFVTNWSSCPSDVDKLIMQHHEKFDGTGFPNKLNFLNIFPLAGIMLIAEDIVYLQLTQPDRSIKDYLVEKESYYSRGDFKKIYSAVLSVFNTTLTD